MAKPSNLNQTQRILEWSLTGRSPSSLILHLCGRKFFVTLRAVKPAGRHRVGCLREHAQDPQPSSCIPHCWILLPSMFKKQEYEGDWCGYKFCFTNNYWMPKTNTDAILANPCRHCPSFSPTKCRYSPTRLEVRAHGTCQQ